MEVILLGVSFVDFVNPDTKEVIQGYSIHFAISQTGCSGFAVQKKFVALNNSCIPDIEHIFKNHKQFPAKADLLFNHKGSLTGIKIK